MSELLALCKATEGRNMLCYATPVPYDQLEEVKIDGRYVKAIQPRIPTGWDFDTKQFVAHKTEVAVVCAGTLAGMAVLRGLGHPANHPDLSRMEQTHGWVYELDESGEAFGDPYGQAVAQLDASVRRQGARLKIYVHLLGAVAPPFSKLPSQPHQYRSYDPIPLPGDRVYEISGLDWPSNIAIVKPYSEYPSKDAFRRDVLVQGHAPLSTLVLP